MNKSLFFIILIIFSFFAFFRFGVLDFLNLNKNSINIEIKKYPTIKGKKANLILKINTIDTIEVKIKNNKFCLEDFPDFYGKDNISLQIGNKVKSFTFNEYKKISYHKVKFNLVIEGIKDNKVMIDWKLHSLNTTSKGKETIDL